MSYDSIKRSDAIKALDNAWINGTSLLDALAFVLPFEKDKAMRMWNERAEGEVRKVK